MKKYISLNGQIKEIDEIVFGEYDYNKAKKFFHCKNCIDQFLGSPLHEVMSPRDYGSYEVGIIGSDNREVVVVWCKRCGRTVWNNQ